MKIITYDENSVRQFSRSNRVIDISFTRIRIHIDLDLVTPRSDQLKKSIGDTLLREAEKKFPYLLFDF